LIVSNTAYDHLEENLSFLLMHQYVCSRQDIENAVSDPKCGKFSFDSTVKPVKKCHPWDVPKVSLIERCPHFTKQFALRTAVWDKTRCPYFTGYPHFAGLLFTGFTVKPLRFFG
jgi:hypothetical protein